MRDEKGTIVPPDQESFVRQRMLEALRKKEATEGVEGASTGTIGKLNASSPISRAFRGEHVPNAISRRMVETSEPERCLAGHPVGRDDALVKRRMQREEKEAVPPEVYGLKNDIEKLNKTIGKLTVAVEQIDEPRLFTIPDEMMTLLKEVARGLQFANDALSPKVKKQLDDCMWARCKKLQDAGFCKKLKDARGYT